MINRIVSHANPLISIINYGEEHVCRNVQSSSPCITQHQECVRHAAPTVKHALTHRRITVSHVMQIRNLILGIRSVYQCVRQRSLLRVDRHVSHVMIHVPHALGIYKHVFHASQIRCLPLTISVWQDVVILSNW